MWKAYRSLSRKYRKNLKRLVSVIMLAKLVPHRVAQGTRGSRPRLFGPPYKSFATTTKTPQLTLRVTIDHRPPQLLHEESVLYPPLYLFLYIYVMGIKVLFSLAGAFIRYVALIVFSLCPIVEKHNAVRSSSRRSAMQRRYQNWPPMCRSLK